MFAESDNGVLPLVKGEEVAAGHNILPSAGSTTETTRVVEVHTERCGLVRIEYQLKSSAPPLERGAGGQGINVAAVCGHGH